MEKKNKRKSIDQWSGETYILPKEIYVLNASALE